MRSCLLRRFAGGARPILTPTTVAAAAALFSSDPFSVQYRRVSGFPRFCSLLLSLWRFWCLTIQVVVLSWCLCVSGFLYVAIVCVLYVPTSDFGMKWSVWVFLPRIAMCLRNIWLLKWSCGILRQWEKCFREWK